MPSIVTLLTDPNRFFAALEDDWGYASPAGVVTVTALVSAAGAYVVMSQLLGSLGGDVQGVGGIAVGAAVFGGFVGAYVVWGVASVVFFLVSVVFDGEGSLGKTAAFVGWGFVPRVVGNVVGLALSALALRDVTPPSDVSQYQAFARQFQHRPLVVASSVVGVVFLLYSGFVWTFALKHARDLSTRGAALTVFVPVGIYALYQLVGLV